MHALSEQDIDKITMLRFMKKHSYTYEVISSHNINEVIDSEQESQKSKKLISSKHES